MALLIPYHTKILYTIHMTYRCHTHIIHKPYNVPRNKNSSKRVSINVCCQTIFDQMSFRASVPPANFFEQTCFDQTYRAPSGAYTASLRLIEHRPNRYKPENPYVTEYQCSYEKFVLIHLMNTNFN